jgi:hypothetical protein
MGGAASRRKGQKYSDVTGCGTEELIAEARRIKAKPTFSQPTADVVSCFVGHRDATSYKRKDFVDTIIVNRIDELVNGRNRHRSLSVHIGEDVERLCEATIFSPVLTWHRHHSHGSSGSIGDLMALQDQDRCDDFLLLLEFSLVLLESKQAPLRTLLPIIYRTTDSNHSLVTQELPQLPAVHSFKTKQALVKLCAEKGFPVSEAQLRRSVKDSVETFLSADGFWNSNNPESLPGSGAFVTLALAETTTDGIADKTTIVVKELAASISARIATNQRVHQQILALISTPPKSKPLEITRDFVLKWLGSDTGYHCFLSCGGDDAKLMVELQVHSHTRGHTRALSSHGLHTADIRLRRITMKLEEVVLLSLRFYNTYGADMRRSQRATTASVHTRSSSLALNSPHSYSPLVASLSFATLSFPTRSLALIRHTLIPHS